MSGYRSCYHNLYVAVSLLSISNKDDPYFFWYKINQGWAEHLSGRLDFMIFSILHPSPHDYRSRLDFLLVTVTIAPFIY